MARSFICLVRLLLAGRGGGCHMWKCANDDMQGYKTRSRGTRGTPRRVDLPCETRPISCRGDQSSAGTRECSDGELSMTGWTTGRRCPTWLNTRDDWVGRSGVVVDVGRSEFVVPNVHVVASKGPNMSGDASPLLLRRIKLEAHCAPSWDRGCCDVRVLVPVSSWRGFVNLQGSSTCAFP